MIRACHPAPSDAAERDPPDTAGNRELDKTSQPAADRHRRRPRRRRDVLAGPWFPAQSPPNHLWRATSWHPASLSGRAPHVAPAARRRPGSSRILSDRLDDQPDDQASQAFDEPSHVSRLRTARLGPAVRVACLCGLRHGNALHEHPETCQAGRHRLQGRTSLAVRRVLLGPRARQPSGNPQPRSFLGGSRARNRVSRRRGIGASSDAGAAAAP
jgi:hypothetical protein